jgi:hypothetical protein
MASNAIEICSAALLKLGASPIDSLTDAAAEAQLANRLYPIIRDGLLSVHPWSFSLAQVALEQSSVPLRVGYDYAFDLPLDCLRVVSAGAGCRPSGLDYRIQGPQLLASSSAITLRYQRRVPEAMFPPFFVAVLVARLAGEFCLPLTENSTRTEGLQQVAAAELRLARLIDSQQSTPRRFEDLTLVRAGEL